MNIAVVDAGNNLTAFVRQDGAWLGSIDIAQSKAYTARAFDSATGDLYDETQPGGSLYGLSASNDGNVITLAHRPVAEPHGHAAVRAAGLDPAAAVRRAPAGSGGRGCTGRGGRGAERPAAMSWDDADPHRAIIPPDPGDALAGPEGTPGPMDEISSALARERAKMAALLHDSSLQLLHAASQDLLAAADGDPDALSYAQSALKQAIGELRQLLSDAGTVPADPADAEDQLPAPVSFISDAARRGGFTVEAHIRTAAPLRFPLIIHQLLREFVGNVAKHAGASHVRITLTSDSEQESLCVQDNGVGMPPPQARAFDGHLGLTLSHERVRGIDGTLEIAERPGGGTMITAVLPRRGSDT